MAPLSFPEAMGGPSGFQGQARSLLPHLQLRDKPNLLYRCKFAGGQHGEGVLLKTPTSPSPKVSGEGERGWAAGSGIQSWLGVLALREGAHLRMRTEEAGE